MENKYTYTYFNILIMQELEKNGINVIRFENGKISAMYQELEIQISHERCSCHGGRLTIHSEHCNFYKRIEHESYDEEKGVIDSDTELEYEIMNEMIDIIKSIKTYIYKLRSERPLHKKDESNIRYFNSINDLSRAVLESSSQDIFTLSDEYIYQCPNPDIQYKINPISYKDGIMELEKQKWIRKDNKSEWVKSDDGYSFEKIYCSIIRK